MILLENLHCLFLLILTPDAETFEVKDDWNTLGMKATQSNTVELKRYLMLQKSKIFNKK